VLALEFSTLSVAALLLFGPWAMTLVATVCSVAHGLGDRSSPLAHRAASTALVFVAAHTAGLVYGMLGGTAGGFNRPQQAVPIAAAIVVYSIVTSAASARFVARFTGGPNRGWIASVLSGCPHHVIGASIGVSLATMIERRMWAVLPVLFVPSLFAYRMYRDYVHRLEGNHRDHDVIESIDHGIAVVDARGVITLWNDALENISGRPREQAVGRALADVLPVLRTTELARAIQDTLTDRIPRALPHVGLPATDGPRVLHVTIRPVAEGVTILWQDVTDRTREEQTAKRREERLALAAEGANDGLWEWDLRSGEFYVSGRWKTMMGLPPSAGTERPEEWINRVHDDDVVGLKEALQAHVSGRTSHFQLEHRIRHEDGTYRRFFCRGLATRGADQRPRRIAGSLTDTTDRAKEQEQLRSAGFRDPLTGLYNRGVFVQKLGQRLDEFKQRRSGDRFAVLYLDLDRFKVVNDSLGHLVGDELLIAVSRRLESCLRPTDALARLGGDEFAILLSGLADEAQANAIAFRIQETLSAPFSIGGREVFSSASIGIAPGLPEYASPEDIMRDADTAMYHAKARGKARHELFDSVMHARTRDRLGLENDLRRAVANNDFDVHYQPIVSLSSGRCVGFESLVRWTRKGEAVSPATFVPMAEELGLIEPLGIWVMEEACGRFAGWKQRYPFSGLDWITVNVSSRQLTQQNFMSIVEQAVKRSGIRPSDLRIEITETALMDNPTAAAEVVRQLRDFGVKIYLDDFGTGYSSLSHLHRLPVDALKIDRSFVNSLLIPNRPATVESILALARTLNTSVVAEGIESGVQARELQRLGCTHAQGFFFSRPLSAAAVEDLLLADEPLGPTQTRPADLLDALNHTQQPYFAPASVEWREEVA
jgi:diguanylate cyclase (GGDEF)-like protein/PAS domain S-box-containing protein